MFRRLLTYQVAVDSGLAAAFFIVTVWIELKTPDSSTLWGAVGGILVCTMFTGAVLLRRLSPPSALITAWGAGILQMGFSRQPSPADAAVIAVIYTASAYGSRRVSRWGFVSALAGPAVGAAYMVAAMPHGVGEPSRLLSPGGTDFVGSALALLLAWVVGALVRTARRAREGHRARLRAEEDARAEAERVRIARDMHDVVAHSLAVVIAQADGARYAAASDPGATAQALGTVSATARSALADVRVLLAQLRHAQDDGPAPTLADLDELFARTRAAGLTLHVRVHPAPPAEIAAAVQLAVYRILQEALTNTLRHGDGEADVTLAWHPDRVDVVVRNMLRRPHPGRDAVTDATDATDAADTDGAAGMPRGHGLIGMRERARLVGGTLDVAADGTEFVLRATLPTVPGETDA